MKLNGTRGKVKRVTIRGINAAVYDAFSKNMKMLTMTMGDAITKMMEDGIKDLDMKFPEISAKCLRTAGRLPHETIMHHNKLNVSAKDLIRANAMVSFVHIDHLQLGPNITKELFAKHIGRIQHCDSVRVPAILPKLLVYSKIQHCNEVNVYKAEISETMESSD